MCRLNAVATRNDNKVNAVGERELEESDGEFSSFLL